MEPIWLFWARKAAARLSNYLNGKVAKGDLAPSIAQLAIAALIPAQIAGPAH